RPRAPVGTMAELSQLSLRALAVAPRAASVERCRRALKFGHGAILVAGFGERSARNRARQRGLDWGSASVRPIGRGQRPFRGARTSRREGGATGTERDLGEGSVGPRGSEGKLHGRCHHLGKSCRAPGLAGAIEGQPTPGEQLEEVRPPAAWNEPQLLITGTAEEQLYGSVWLHGLEHDAGESCGGPGCDEPFVKVAREFDALLRGGERDVQIADGERDEGPVEEVSSKRRR